MIGTDEELPNPFCLPDPGTEQLPLPLAAGFTTAIDATTIQPGPSMDAQTLAEMSSGEGEGRFHGFTTQGLAMTIRTEDGEVATAGQQYVP